MRDLRQDLKNLFDRYSHNIVYIRRNTRHRCRCYSERSGDVRGDCSRCFGTGYEVTVEKQRTRRQLSSVPETLTNLNREYGAGRVTPKAYVYYLEHFVKPVKNDLILEVRWKDGIPISIDEKYLISVSDPMRGYNGRVEFYQVYVKYFPKGSQDDEAISIH